MVSFGSNEEFFQAVDELAAKLELNGCQRAAVALRDGLGCLNGLTDGWALLLESIDGILATKSGEIDVAERHALKAIRAAVFEIVHRR
jgi:hypothetical protein